MAFKKIIEEMYNRRVQLRKRYDKERQKPAFLIKQELDKEIPSILKILENIKLLHGTIWRNGLNMLRANERNEPERRLNIILQSSETIKVKLNQLKENLGYYSPFVDDDAMERKKQELLKYCDEIIQFCEKIAENARHLEKEFPNQHTELRSIQSGSAQIIKIFEKKGFFG